MGRFFHRLYRRRQDADYADQVQFSSDQVEAWLQEAQSFSERLSKEIRDGLSGLQRGE